MLRKKVDGVWRGFPELKIFRYGPEGRHVKLFAHAIQKPSGHPASGADTDHSQQQAATWRIGEDAKEGDASRPLACLTWGRTELIY